MQSAHIRFAIWLKVFMHIYMYCICGHNIRHVQIARSFFVWTHTDTPIRLEIFHLSCCIITHCFNLTDFLSHLDSRLSRLGRYTNNIYLSFRCSLIAIINRACYELDSIADMRYNSHLFATRLKNAWEHTKTRTLQKSQNSHTFVLLRFFFSFLSLLLSLSSCCLCSSFIGVMSRVWK